MVQTFSFYNDCEAFALLIGWKYAMGLTILQKCLVNRKYQILDIGSRQKLFMQYRIFVKTRNYNNNYE